MQEERMGDEQIYGRKSAVPVSVEFTPRILVEAGTREREIREMSAARMFLPGTDPPRTSH